MVWGVAVYRRRLEGGWKSGRCRVYFRRGTHHPEAGQAAFVCEEEVKMGKAGLDGQDVGRSARETVRRPLLDCMPEGQHFSCHMNSRSEHVRAITEDREKER